MKTDQHPVPDLWSLVRGAPWIDPKDLLAAVESELQSDRIGHDHRTRLLIRESLCALEERWGKDRLIDALSAEDRERAIAYLIIEPNEIGFPTLGKRMQDRTDTETILSFFRELGAETIESVRLEVGGSTALILANLLRRGTDDIDVVNEVPAVLRVQHDLLSRLADRHGLLLTHFQSHYLPAGYENRLHYLDRFRLVDVYLVDSLDIFVGKLFSRRDKDLDDLRMLHAKFSKDDILERYRSSGEALRSDPQFKQNAIRNWYVLFGEDLPVP